MKSSHPICKLLAVLMTVGLLADVPPVSPGGCSSRAEASELLVIDDIRDEVDASKED